MGTRIIELKNADTWTENLNVLKSDMSKAMEIDEDTFDHFLGCVPPIRQVSRAFACGEPYTHNNEGQAIYLCCFYNGSKYYAQYGTTKQFDKRELFKNER